jgi:hypothetical protein
LEFVVQPAPALQALHPPLRHTPPAQVVPLLLFEPSTHTGMPVLQSMLPLRQAELGFGVQPAPWVHALQKPLLHTPPGHEVPFVLFDPSTHCALPELQSMTPLRHALPGLVVQAAPALQALHAPLLHTPPAHAVPFALFEPSTHWALPELQSMTPLRQALPGLVVQAAPALQALHEPLLQTPPAQAVPLGLLLPLAQTAAPELHSVTPLVQALLGFEVQAAPCVHITHWSEALHTWLVPQEAPVPRRVPCMHTGAPEVHEMLPVKHGFVGVHVAPPVQFTQAPAELHTWLVPHTDPGALLLPSTQASAPDEQSVMPLRQRFGLMPQTLPAAHATQVPEPLHTWPAPQDVPAAALVVASTHTELPVLQSTRPLRQGAPGLVLHAAPAMQAPQLPVASHTWPEPHEVPAALLLPLMHVWVPVAHEVMPLRQPGLGFEVHGWLETHVRQLPVALHTWFVPHTVPAGRLPESMHV